VRLVNAGYWVGTSIRVLSDSDEMVFIRHPARRQARADAAACRQAQEAQRLIRARCRIPVLFADLAVLHSSPCEFLFLEGTLYQWTCLGWFLVYFVAWIFEISIGT
jgi:hypothetical protein